MNKHLCNFLVSGCYRVSRILGNGTMPNKVHGSLLDPSTETIETL